MEGEDNIVAALERNDRVCQVKIMDVPSRQLEIIAAAMPEPFPALTHLHIGTYDRWVILPSAFLGGSAPRLRSLYLAGIPFPALPKLLLSATGLVYLGLWGIPPPSGYISPGAMVACLSAMARLETLHLGFRSPRSVPDLINRRPPPLRRTVLPALTELKRGERVLGEPPLQNRYPSTQHR